MREALSFVELEHTIDMFPSELSGGMRRRVAIARAIITHPEVLLYDSPTGGLDPVTSTTIIELIVKQRDVYKTSSLLVTHRLQDAFTMATHYFDRKANKMQPLPKGERGEVPMRFLILRDGKVIFDGDAHELAHSKDEYIREYHFVGMICHPERSEGSVHLRGAAKYRDPPLLRMTSFSSWPLRPSPWPRDGSPLGLPHISTSRVPALSC